MRVCESHARTPQVFRAEDGHDGNQAAPPQGLQGLQGDSQGSQGQPKQHGPAKPAVGTCPLLGPGRADARGKPLAFVQFKPGSRAMVSAGAEGDAVAEGRQVRGSSAFMAARLHMTDPSALKKLSLSSGGRKRVRSCVAAALGGAREDGDGEADGALLVQHVVVERVCVVTPPRAQGAGEGMQTRGKLASSVDVFIRIAISEGAGGGGAGGAEQRWWTRSERWVERRLNREFDKAGLPACAVKHWKLCEITSSSAVPPANGPAPASPEVQMQSKTSPLQAQTCLCILAEAMHTYASVYTCLCRGCTLHCRGPEAAETV